MKNCADDMKNYVMSSDCRRKEHSSFFPHSSSVSNVSGCKCCDICAKDCQCNESSCLAKKILWPMSVLDEDEPSSIVVRHVSKESKKLLKKKLQSYRRASLLPSSTDSFTPVSYPNLFLEFGEVQIKQVLEHCDKILTISDIMKYVEIWREVYANNILLALYEVFNDFVCTSSEISY